MMWRRISFILKSCKDTKYELVCFQTIANGYFNFLRDYNEQDEPLRDRIRRFKDIKSPGTLGILLKEIANARSPQELIGCLKIPVSVFKMSF